MENLRDIKLFGDKGKVTEHKLEIKLDDDPLSNAVYSIYCANTIIKGTATKVERNTIDLARIRNRLEDAIDSINKELLKYEARDKSNGYSI